MNLFTVPKIETCYLHVTQPFEEQASGKQHSCRCFLVKFGTNWRVRKVYNLKFCNVLHIEGEITFQDTILSTKYKSSLYQSYILIGSCL